MTDEKLMNRTQAQVKKLGLTNNQESRKLVQNIESLKIKCGAQKRKNHQLVKLNKGVSGEEMEEEDED